jgi:hypothetical protein
MNFQIQRKDFHSFIVDRCKNVSIKTPTLEISFNARIASVVKDYESKKVFIISNIIIEIDYDDPSNSSYLKADSDFTLLISHIAWARN